MNTKPSRRSIAELLVCATFVAALAVGPALAAPPADNPGKGRESAPGQVAKAPAAAPAPAAAAPAPAPATRPATPKSAKGSGKSAKDSGAAGTTKSQRPAPRRRTAPATTTANTTNGGGSAKASAPSASRVTTSSGSSARSSGTPAATNGSNSRASRTRAAARATTQTAAASTQTAAAGGAVATTTSSAQAAAAAAETAAASRRDASSTSLRSAALAAATRRKRLFYERRNQPLGIEGVAGTTAVAPRSSLLGVSLSQAEAAALGVRQRGVGSAADVPRAEARVEPLQSRSPLSRALSGVVEVIPPWVWIALGVLSLLVLALGAHTILATARTRRLEHHRAKLMEDVGLLQEALLPAVPARMGRVTTSVAYRPADGLAAGGDFYDAFALPGGRVGLLLGDVSGHGREALAKTALVRFTVRAHLEAGMSPREALSIAGRSLDGRLGDDFATVIAAIHDPDQGTLTYSSAGHPPPLVVGPPAHDPLTAASAPPIDAGFPTGHRQTVLPMPEGTTVALYSDGLIEARIDGEAIGPERLTEWLADLGPDATAKRLLELVVERADRVRDDLAAVVLHAELGTTAPETRIEQLKLDVLDADGPDLDAFLQAAGVSRAERRLAGRRVSEELAVTGGVMVAVRAGEHPQVDVSPIGGGGVRASRSRARMR